MKQTLNNSYVLLIRNEKGDLQLSSNRIYHTPVDMEEVEDAIDWAISDDNDNKILISISDYITREITLSHWREK